MKKSVVFRGHLFKLTDATVFAEDGQGAWVGRTPNGTWFVFDDHRDDQIVAALFEEDQDNGEIDFAETLVDFGFAQVVMDHFGDIADQVIPEA